MKELKRLYYPLPDAALKLGVSINDVMHYGATGILDFYVFINNLQAPDNKWFHLSLPSDEANNIDCFGCLSGGGWLIHDVSMKRKDEGFIIDGHYAKSISGFFHVDDTNIRPLEFSETALVETMFLLSEPEKGDAMPIYVNCMLFNLSLERDYLCILGKDIDDLLKKDSRTDSDKTIAKKAELIPALLKMVPELSDLNLDTTPVSKVIEIVEAIAAQKGIHLPEIHRQTWQKYLGRK